MIGELLTEHSCLSVLCFRGHLSQPALALYWAAFLHQTISVGPGTVKES